MPQLENLLADRKNVHLAVSSISQDSVNVKEYILIHISHILFFDGIQNVR